jgi:hypothetical protein
MAELISEEGLTTAWVRAFERLMERQRVAFDLLVNIEDPCPEYANPSIIAALDSCLLARGKHPVLSVANTIFPLALARSSINRATLYARYRALAPRLRRLSRSNSRGTYFERLIAFPLQTDPARANQLESIIHNLGSELHRSRTSGGGPLGHIYEAQIFAPGLDRRPIGFPCLSSLSFHLDREHLRLSATYRNQYYIERALGNFLGLANLLHFAANEVGLGVGPLSIHAFHAEVDREIPQRDAGPLLTKCLALLTPPLTLAQTA